MNLAELKQQRRKKILSKIKGKKDWMIREQERIERKRKCNGRFSEKELLRPTVIFL